MPEYINREAIPIKQFIKTAQMFSEDIVCAVGTGFMEDIAESENKELFEIINAIRTAPAADVAEVKHGEWIEETFETLIPVEFDENDEPILHKHIRYKCSVCGRKERYKELFCHCGADMRGKQCQNDT